MKGLVLKDLYMMRKYCRSALLVIAVFLVAGAVTLYHNMESGNYMFFILYACVLSGMIPVTLLSYDERSKWNEYSGTLPYSKAQIVSVKYLIGICAQMLVWIVCGVVQAVELRQTGTFMGRDFFTQMSILLVASCMVSGVSLPFIFRFGVEKGRIAYYIIIVIACGGSMILGGVFDENLRIHILSGVSLLGIYMAVVIGYIISWRLSVMFYQRRELD